MPPPQLLIDNVNQIRTIHPVKHGIIYDFQNWCNWLNGNQNWKAFADDFNHDVIARGDLFAYALNHDDNDGWQNVFYIAAMVWGYGVVGYGPWRTLHGLNQGNLTQHLARIFNYITNDELENAYHIVKINYCGPAFFTKLFYFFGRDQVENYPLILDSVIANRLEEQLRLNPMDYARFSRNRHGQISAIRKYQKGYIQYVNDMHEWANELQCNADQIELFLFNI
jgi:hypothetical protein